MNSKIRQLEDTLINVLNSSEVEIEVKRLVVGNIYHLIEKKADEIILKEQYEETVKNAPDENGGDIDEQST